MLTLGIRFLIRFSEDLLLEKKHDFIEFESVYEHNYFWNKNGYVEDTSQQP
jgi:hypothetical protein